MSDVSTLATPTPRPPNLGIDTADYRENTIHEMKAYYKQDTCRRNVLKSTLVIS